MLLHKKRDLACTTCNARNAERTKKYLICFCWVRNWEHLISDGHTPAKPVGQWACDTAGSSWSLLNQKECRRSFLVITYLLNYLLTNWLTYLLQSCSMLCSIATNGAARCTLCSIALAHILRIDNQAHGQDGRGCDITYLLKYLLIYFLTYLFSYLFT